MTDDVQAVAGHVFDLARGGETDALAAYLDAGAPVDLTNEKGDTLLILASYHEHEDTVALLLERGADVTRLNDRGQNALVCAVFKQSPGIVRRLVAAGADPDAGTPSARATAQYFGAAEIASLLER